MDFLSICSIYKAEKQNYQQQALTVSSPSPSQLTPGSSSTVQTKRIVIVPLKRSSNFRKRYIIDLVEFSWINSLLFAGCCPWGYIKHILFGLRLFENIPTLQLVLGKMLIPVSFLWNMKMPKLQTGHKERQVF